MPTQKLQTTTTAAGAQLRLTFYLPPETTRQATATRVREMPAGEQPTVRLHSYGAGALSIGELLVVLLNLSDLESATKLLAEADGLAGLARKPLCELLELRGIGTAKAAQLHAAFELGRRLLVAAPHERTTIKSPADARQPVAHGNGRAGTRTFGYRDSGHQETAYSRCTPSMSAR